MGEEKKGKCEPYDMTALGPRHSSAWYLFFTSMGNMRFRQRQLTRV